MKHILKKATLLILTLFGTQCFAGTANDWCVLRYNVYPREEKATTPKKASNYLRDSREVHVIPYFQMDFLLPGVGLAIQSENLKSPIGVEIDIGVSSILVAILAKGAASLLIFSESHKHALNVGVGIAGFADAFSSTDMGCLLVPLAYSYKGENNVYTRIGLNFFIFEKEYGRYYEGPRQKYDAGAFPFYRIGHVF